MKLKLFCSSLKILDDLQQWSPTNGRGFFLSDQTASPPYFSALRTPKICSKGLWDPLEHILLQRLQSEEDLVNTQKGWQSPTAWMKVHSHNFECCLILSLGSSVYKSANKWASFLSCSSKFFIRLEAKKQWGDHQMLLCLTETPSRQFIFKTNEVAG